MSNKRTIHTKSVKQRRKNKAAAEAKKKTQIKWEPTHFDSTATSLVVSNGILYPVAGWILLILLRGKITAVNPAWVPFLSPVVGLPATAISLHHKHWLNKKYILRYILAVIATTFMIIFIAFIIYTISEKK